MTNDLSLNNYCKNATFKCETVYTGFTMVTTYTEGCIESHKEQQTGKVGGKLQHKSTYDRPPH